MVMVQLPTIGWRSLVWYFFGNFRAFRAFRGRNDFSRFMTLRFYAVS
jgi:hypothetical protein